MKKTKTYMDKLLNDKEFHERFDKEYQNLCVAEKFAENCHKEKLTQADLAKRAENSKIL